MQSKRYLNNAMSAPKSQTAATEILSGFLREHPEINFIQLRWTNFSGLLHTKFVTTSFAKDIAAGKRHFSTNQSGMVIPIATAPKCETVRVMRSPIEPDWDSLQPCSFTPGHASVMCSIATDGEDDPYLQCPRHLLEATLQEIQDKDGVSFLIGFEIEFALLDESFEPAQSIDPVISYCMNSGLRCNTLKIMEQICHALEHADIGVYHFHTEEPHQLEISLTEKPPMQAIDGLAFACEAIRAIAAQHGLKATMTPKPMALKTTSGLHMHISSQGLENRESFLAGILNKLRAITIFGIANYDGFKRVKEDGAGEFVAWGTEHRDLPVRQIDSSHWELRFADATANFYLFLTVVLKAAMAGVHGKEPLVQKDVRKFPKDINASEWIEEYRVTERLPYSLKEAIGTARADPDIAKWIGQYMFDRYIRIKEIEVELLGPLTDEQRRQRFVSFF